MSFGNLCDIICYMREKTFEKEKQFFSEYAVFSDATKGRKIYEEPCPLRTEFQRDRDRILHCKSFRRLKNKTQVFLMPDGDHYRTRLTHTLDVCQIGRSIARFLDLNEDLTEAIALGHDLGHAPFGHSGERILNSLSNGNFAHNEQSLRLVDVLENDGLGLNLTEEVKDGILNHRTDGNPQTLEGKIVCFADKIAYINHDIDDSLRAGMLTENDIPKEAVKILGKTARERINNMITAILRESTNKPKITMAAPELAAMNILRDFMFERIYMEVKTNREDVVVDRIIELLYNHYFQTPEKMPDFYKGLLDKYPRYRVVCDYISGMTDNYAVQVFKEIFTPKNWV